MLLVEEGKNLKRKIFIKITCRTLCVSVAACQVVLYLLAWSVLPAHAFSIRPEGTERGGTVRRFQLPWHLRSLHPVISGVLTDLFSTPVHERMTHMVYGCEGDESKCSKPERDHSFSPASVIAGAQWNDNPPFELTSTSEALKSCTGKTIRMPYFPVCWFQLFRDAEKRAKRGEVLDADSNVVLLYRVHFGDMQFLHSMASHDGEEAQGTKAKIMMWAEFTYKIAIGELARGVELRKIGIPGMETLFKNRGWTAQQLFTRGDPTYRGEEDFRNFAFGSLLHLAEDSFSLSHTERDEPSGAKCDAVPEQYKPGKILTFHSYINQDKRKHADADKQTALSIHLAEKEPNAVDVGKVLRAYYERKRPWDEVRQYLECVFELADPAAKAGAGMEFLAE